MFDDPVPPGENDKPRRPSTGRARVVLALLAVTALFQASDVLYGTPTVTAPGARLAVSSRGFGNARATRFGSPGHGARLVPSDVRTYRDAALYDISTLRTIFMQFGTSGWEQQLESAYRTGSEVPATVTIDGAVYRDVGVHFRGNSSYRMVPTGFKRSFNLSFDHLHKDQHIGGYRTLNLLNANSDPTFVRTALYSEIARKYLPAPKVNFVRVVINGESWGIYLNVQQFNKDFLRDYYGTTRGARWKVPGSPRGRAGLEYLGDAVESYKGLYEIKTKDDPKAWADLVRLCRLLGTTVPEKLEAVLAPHLDVDEVLKFLALDVALVNTDGYWTRASDYSIYQEPGGRFHILPYDFNEGMGVQGFGRRGGYVSGPTVDPLVGLDDPSKPLRSRLLAVPALRERYLAHVKQIAEQWLDWRKLSPLVEQYQALIEADVRADGKKLYGFDGFDPASPQQFFDARRAFLLQ